jgi:hypothetical protein
MGDSIRGDKFFLLLLEETKSMWLGIEGIA